VAPLTDRSRGHLFLIEAMRKVYNEFPYTYLLVAGGLRNPGLLDEVNERINSLDLHRRAGIGVSVVAADSAHAVEVLDAAERLVAARPEIELLSARRGLHRSDDWA